MTAAKAYQEVTGKTGVKPQYMTNNQMQRAIDDIYQSQYSDDYNSRVVMGLTSTEDGRVILSANSQVPGSDAITRDQQIFNNKVEVIRGSTLTNYSGLPNSSHTEARAAI